jgi:hypothetical protein
MLTLRCQQLFFWGILALLMVAVIPWPVQAGDYGTEDLTLGSRSGRQSAAAGSYRTGL